MNTSTIIEQKRQELNDRAAELQLLANQYSQQIQGLNIELAKVNLERNHVKIKTDLLDELRALSDAREDEPEKKMSLRRRTEEFYRYQQGEFSVDDVRKALGVTIEEGQGIRVALSEAAKPGRALERVRTGVYRLIRTAPSKTEQNGAAPRNLAALLD